MADNDFTDLDAVAVKRRLTRNWQGYYPDYDPSRPSPDTRILEQFATVWERLGFYVDARGREAHLPTAVERQSLLDHGVLIGFVPSTRVAARADVVVTVTRTVVPGADVVIEQGQVIRSAAGGDQIEYQTLADLTIEPDGQSVQTGTVTAENSKSATDTFPATGALFQRLRLSQSPFLDQSLVVSDDLGVFELVSTLTASGSDDAHYTIRIDADERVTLHFGDGFLGRLPSGTITASYRVGGGVFGEVEPGQLQVLATSQFEDELGNPVVISVTNPLASTPGADRQSVEELRRVIPNAAITQQRAVTNTDYENGVTARVAGVARALALTSNEAPALVPINETWVYVVPNGGGTPTQALLDEVALLFSDDGALPAGNTVRVRVFAAPYLDVAITTRVLIAPNQDRSAVRESVADALAAYFDPENVVTFTQLDGSRQTVYTVAFGHRFAVETGQLDGQLSWSAILCEIEGEAGVSKVDDTADRLLLNGADEDLELEPQEFPRLVSVTVIDAATGTVIPPV